MTKLLEIDEWTCTTEQPFWEWGLWLPLAKPPPGIVAEAPHNIEPLYPPYRLTLTIERPKQTRESYIRGLLGLSGPEGSPFGLVLDRRGNLRIDLHHERRWPSLGVWRPGETVHVRIDVSHNSVKCEIYVRVSGDRVEEISIERPVRSVTALKLGLGEPGKEPPAGWGPPIGFVFRDVRLESLAEEEPELTWTVAQHAKQIERLESAERALYRALLELQDPTNTYPSKETVGSIERADNLIRLVRETMEKARE